MLTWLYFANGDSDLDLARSHIELVVLQLFLITRRSAAFIKRCFVQTPCWLLNLHKGRAILGFDPLSTLMQDKKALFFIESLVFHPLSYNRRIGKSSSCPIWCPACSHPIGQSSVYKMPVSQAKDVQPFTLFLCPLTLPKTEGGSGLHEIPWWRRSPQVLYTALLPSRDSPFVLKAIFCSAGMLSNVCASCNFFLIWKVSFFNLTTEHVFYQSWWSLSSFGFAGATDPLQSRQTSSWIHMGDSIPRLRFADGDLP